MSTLIPRPLRRGDKVAIVAPARSISLPEIEPSIRLLESWGLSVVVPEGLFAVEGQLAGSDAHRAALLQGLIDDDSIRAVFCARGGYGSVRIVDRLDWSRFSTNPKWVVGYSDVTVFHNHIHSHLSASTLHATMPINITPESVDSWSCVPALSSLHEALFDDHFSVVLEPSRPALNPADVEGEVVGGNLSMIYSLCGSPSDLCTDGKVLLIEDLDEYLYHVDRMMQNLKRTGKLRNLKALVVGAMSDMHDNSVPFGKGVYDIVLDAVGEARYPVFFTDQVGHVGLQNRAIPLGRPCCLRVGERGTLRLDF